MTPLTIAFINYGSASSNSGNHIVNFARQLQRLGHEALLVNYKTDDPDEEAQGIRQRSYDEFWQDLEAGALSSIGLLLHAWTPRENVRGFVDKAVSRFGLPYVVHLEDNELAIIAARLGMAPGELLLLSRSKVRTLVPKSFTNPVEMRSFLKRARGITVIVPSLADLIPKTKRHILLEPGVDANLFCPVSREARDDILLELGLPRENEYVVYPGNTHAANKRDMSELYTAVNSLREEGRKVALIRTGRDYTRPDPTALRCEDWLFELGVLDRSKLIRVLQVASFFVQPGAIDEFNSYRLPSKIPECLAIGRPVIIPRTNVGLRMRHNDNAMLMSKGDNEEIAASLRILMDKPCFAERIGANGRKFAIENFNWTSSARTLADFYADIWREQREPQGLRRLKDWLSMSNADGPKG